MAKRTAVSKRSKAGAGRRKATAKRAVKRPGSKKAAPKRAARRVVSRTQEGRVTLPGPAKHLALEELRDRILIAVAALVETERVPGRSYKMVLVVKRTRNTPLSYKLVVERSG